MYGKTVQKEKGKQDIWFVYRREELAKLSKQVNFKDRDIIVENGLTILMMKVSSFVHKFPRYVGTSVLELSKLLMYDFHYDYILEKYGGNAQLFMTDTDSLMYNIKTEDFYEDIKDDINARFDTSEYSEDHLDVKKHNFLVGRNKKGIEMFKDELKGVQFVEFAGLNAKTYSYSMSTERRKRSLRAL